MPVIICMILGHLLNLSVFFLWPYLWHTDVPGPGTESVNQGADPESESGSCSCDSPMPDPLTHWVAIYASTEAQAAAVRFLTHCTTAELFFFCLHPQHVEIPRPGIELAPQQRPKLLQ